MPKISIVVPIYNVEKYLQECLDSIVNQTMQDIEIILVDDGSTDNSPSICDKYATLDNRIKVIHKKNEGLGKAYNTGIEASSGEYIGLIESDDFAELNMFEDLYKLAKENNADIVKSDWYEYWSKPNKYNRKKNRIRKFGIKDNEIVSVENHPEILTIAPSVWSAIYNRTFLNSNNLRFLETPGASYQDTSFAFKTLSCAKRVILTDKHYVHYRQDNESSSVKAKGKVFMLCEEYKELDTFLDARPDIKNFVEQYKWINQYHGYEWNLNRLAKEHQKAFLEFFASTFKDAKNNNILNEIFYKNINLKNFNLLITNPNKFLKTKQIKLFFKRIEKFFRFINKLEVL